MAEAMTSAAPLRPAYQSQSSASAVFGCYTVEAVCPRANARSSQQEFLGYETKGKELSGLRKTVHS